MSASRIVVCAQCGNEFEATSSRAKYCSPKCRKAANRRPTGRGKLEDEAPEALKADVVRTVQKFGPIYDSLADQIKTSLTELDALATISGMAALRVAQQIDRGGDSGSAVATLTKELSRLVDAATVESAPRRKDGADEIASRVIAKLQGLST